MVSDRVVGRCTPVFLLLGLWLLPVPFHSAALSAPPRQAALERTRVAPLGFASLDGPHAIYFVMVDRFADGAPNLPDVDKNNPGLFHGGDLQGLTERLEHLKALGVDTLWLSPLALQVPARLPGKDADGRPFLHAGFHGYWAEDFTRIDPHFGDEQALARLLDEAHQLQMRVILDVVVNHFGYGASALAVPRLVRDPKGPCQATTDPLRQCLFGLPDIRTEDAPVADLVVEWTSDWFRRFAFDGIRFDTFKHAEPRLFARVAAAAKAEHRRRTSDASTFLVVGEWWGAKPGDGTLKRINDDVAPLKAADTLLDFEFSSLAVDFAAGRLRAEALAHHLQRRHAAPGPPWAHFLSSHDTPALTTLLQDAPAATPLAVLLQMTTRGIPVIPWGEERGREGGPWPHNRRSIDWQAPAPAEVLWRQLLRARNQRPALRSRAFRTLYAKTSDTGSTLIFSRGSIDDDVIVVLHRGDALTLAPLGKVLAGYKRCLSVGGSVHLRPNGLAMEENAGALFSRDCRGIEGDLAGGRPRRATERSPPP